MDVDMFVQWEYTARKKFANVYEPCDAIISTGSRQKNLVYKSAE